MKNVPLNDLSRLSEAEVAELSQRAQSVISSGHFLFGPHTEQFSAALSARVNGRPVVCVGNGTDALYLGLKTLGVGYGSRVATIANAGGYASGAAIRLGAVPVMIDADPVTAQMSLDSLTSVLDSHGADVVVITHLYGLVSGVSDLAALCVERGVPVLEDCAQAFGCMSDGRAVGTFGTVATFSFYPTKNLGALGDAGAVATATTALAEKAQQLAQYGWGARYVVSEPGGFNTRIDEMQAAFLNYRLGTLDADNTRRRQIVLHYQSACSGNRLMVHSAGPEFIGHLAVLLTECRDSDQAALGKLGIGTGIHYPVLDHHQPGWSGLIENPGTKCADQLVTRILTLPCFPSMTDEEVERVTAAVASLN